jgi:hypothetical protein
MIPTMIPTYFSSATDLPDFSLKAEKAATVVCTENLNPNVVVMKPAKDRA